MATSGRLTVEFDPNDIKAKDANLHVVFVVGEETEKVTSTIFKNKEFII